MAFDCALIVKYVKNKNMSIEKEIRKKPRETKTEFNKNWRLPS